MTRTRLARISRITVGLALATVSARADTPPAETVLTADQPQ